MPRTEIEHSELKELLDQTSTTPERVRGLLAILHPSELITALEVSPSTLRSWRADNPADPRPDTWRTLDDLRTVASLLLEGGMSADGARGWLVGRGLATFDENRIDEFRSNPEAVLRSARAVALELV